MEWYLPMTLIPGIGLIIASTSSIMLALNNEIGQLELAEKKETNIINLKLSQLKTVSVSIVFQYLGIIFFLFSGIVESLFSYPDTVPKGLLSVGVLVVTFSIILLLIYSIRAVSIRQQHLKL